MKKDNTIVILTLVIVAVLIVGSWYLVKESKGNGLTGNDGGDSQHAHTLVGSSDNYESLPPIFVFADSTTTDDSNVSDQLEDGGAIIYQTVSTLGADWVYLDIHAVAGTATSSLLVRQMSSYDGINYSNIATSTLFSTDSVASLTATSTITARPVSAITWDPGLASTTDGILIPFKTNGAPFTRFVLSTEDLAKDPDDGVQAWIVARIPENL